VSPDMDFNFVNFRKISSIKYFFKLFWVTTVFMKYDAKMGVHCFMKNFIKLHTLIWKFYIVFAMRIVICKSVLKWLRILESKNLLALNFLDFWCMLKFNFCSENDKSLEFLIFHSRMLKIWPGQGIEPGWFC